MNKICIKRGSGTPANLDAGELALDTTNNILFAGADGNTVVPLIGAAGDLPDVGTSGTYSKVTTDSKGRVVSGSTLSESDIPALSAYATAAQGALAASASQPGHTHQASQVTGLSAVATSGSATDLSTGTLPDARLSGNVVLTTDSRLSDARVALAHTHPISQVTGLQTALDGKQVSGSYAAASHSHAISDVTGLQTALDGKQAAGSYAAASHTHKAEDITTGTLAISRIPTGSSATTVCIGDDSRLSDSRSPTAHQHPLSDITQSSASAGQVAAWNGTSWSPTTPTRSADVQIFSSTGTSTWNKPTGAKSVLVQLIGGGGSGGSGRKGTSGTACGGGSGGGGGSYLSYIVSAALLGNSESVIIGAGGTAVAGTGSLGTDGNAGGTTQFAFLRAPGGSGGQGGGGAAVAGGLGGAFDGNNGGAVSVAGTSTPQNGVPSDLNSTARLGGAGGGAGGSITTAGSPLAGGAGGRSLLIGLVGGTAGSTSSAGGNGNNAPTNYFAAGSGGGGGGGSATLGLAGGNGGFPGGGGGGGGATLGATSGASGAGASGMAIITTFF